MTGHQKLPWGAAFAAAAAVYSWRAGLPVLLLAGSLIIRPRATLKGGRADPNRTGPVSRRA